MPRLWLWWVDAEWMPGWMANRAIWSLQEGGPVAWPWRLYCWLHRRHRPSDDHCGRPEHRYCAICGKATPGALVTR
jgi:hypothetical protein